MTATHEIVVHHQVGLHARPAARFVTTAAGFDADIEVENLSRGAGPTNAKSILGVLSLGVTRDQAIRGRRADRADRGQLRRRELRT
jgi:phosphotransferase system HPr (HPr) family protein